MPNSAGVEVARISVKVSPDTSKFYEELKRKLKAIEKALGKDGIDVGDAEVGTEKAEKKVATATKRMSKNKVKVGVEANKIDTAAISRDIGKSFGALDKFAGKFDVKNGLFWDPKEGQEATQVAIDNFKILKEQSDKLAAAESKRLSDITTKTKKLAVASKKASDAAKFDIDTSKFKIKPMAIDKSIEALDKSSGKIVLWEDKQAEKLAESFNKAVPGIQKKLDTLDLNWDKKMRDFKLAPTLVTANNDLRVDLANNVREMDRLIEKSKEASEATDRLFASMDRKTISNALKPYIDGVKELDGRKSKNKGGGLGVSLGGNPDFNFSKLMPNFGSGINPAGYVAILAAVALVAAPLVGLVSTLVLAIPGMISAIATPMMAIGLGMDGIKKAGANSGLFKYDDEGKLEGLGAVFDNVKTKVSAAFETGLTPALQQLAGAIDPLLGSLPKVATGLTDMFQGFMDSLTSPEGTALFDDTIAKIGQAMSAAAPGIQSFTDGMLGVANSFANQLPKFSTWLNTTGDSFAAWVTKMTTVPDPAGHHGPNGPSPMESAFTGLGDTLKVIGDWAIDMAQAGIKFVSDPNKMKDFLKTLDDIGAAITKLVDIGNRLGPAWAFMAGTATPDGQTEANMGASKTLADVEAGKDIPKPDESWTNKLGDFFKDWPTKGIFDNLFPKGDLKSQIKGVESEISAVTAELRDKMENGGLTPPAGMYGNRPKPDAILNSYKERIADLQSDLAELEAQQAALMPQVALKSFESPLPVEEGGKPTFVSQLLTDLKGVPAAAAPAKDALQAVNETGIMTPEALGQLSQNAQPPAVAVPEAPTEIPAPDTSAFNAAIQELPTATATAMQGVAEAVTTGGQTAVGNLLIAGQQMVATLQTFTGLFQTAGQQMMMGLSNGITVGTAWVVAAARSAAAAAHAAAKEELEINSPSKKFIEIGLSTMEGMSKGMEDGVKPVMDQAKDMADKVARAFADGSDPTVALQGFDKKEISKMEKLLKFDSSQLRRQIAANNSLFKSTGDGAYKAEADRLSGIKEGVDGNREMLDLANEYNETTSGGEDPFVKAASGLMNSPVDFAKATGKQFMSDLGIGGNGLIGNAITEGISYIFNIASVDEALSVKDREDNKAMQSGLGR